MCKSTFIVKEHFMDILEGTNNNFMVHIHEFIMMIISHKQSNQVDIYNDRMFVH